MPISPQSAKAKGRRLQQWVRDELLSRFTSLTLDDIRSTSMGAGGEDIQLSSAARLAFPYSIECKMKKSMAIYQMYDQAVANAKSNEPLLIVRADRRKALAVMNAEHFFDLIKVK